jgi:hypothetical protein
MAQTTESLDKVQIVRVDTGDQGTFGKIYYKQFVAFTGELPDRGNKSNVSCIPKGIYKCVWTYSPRFKRKMYLLENVKGRTGIRIHLANFMGDAEKGYKKQLNGCIALGENLGKMDGQKALLISGPAIRRFEKVMGGKPFVLEII